jgi:hypothetical protein
MKTEYKKALIAITTFLMVSFLTGCQKEKSAETNQGNIGISFRLMVNGEPLRPGQVYVNSSGEPYTVSLFRFYASGISVTNTATRLSSSEQDSYHLLKLDDPSSLQFVAKFNNGTYNQLSFLVGIDSLHNVSGAQTGALDPLNGMFWTWNSGYIFAKMEGKSGVSPLPQQQFAYHIGGFRAVENAIRKIELPFPNGQQAELGQNRSNTLVIDAEISKWFSGSHALSIAATPSVTTPGTQALLVADNYATLFYISSLVSQ